MAQTSALDRRWIGWTRHSAACFVAISVTALGARYGPAVAGAGARREAPSRARWRRTAAPDE